MQAMQPDDPIHSHNQQELDREQTESLHSSASYARQASRDHH